MIARTVSGGWQTILADLALILFMVTAAALANAPDAPPAIPRAAPPHPAPSPAPVPVQAEPVALWRAAADAPPLGAWLNEAARDPRLGLTITVRYAPGGRRAAIAEAQALSAAAGPRGAAARIVIEPGDPTGASATVAFDAPAQSGTPLAGPGA